MTHKHEYIEKENYLICECGKKKLKLFSTDKEGLYRGRMKNNKRYLVRVQRKRYFFPDEWESFYKTLKREDHKLFYLIALHTGGRVMEIVNLRPCDFDYERKTITFETVKKRTAKKNFYAAGKSRTFFVSGELLKKVKFLVNKYKIEQKEYFFLDNEKLPTDYQSLPNSEKKKYYEKASVNFSQIFKRKVEEAGIKDWWNFSLHNIRKTYGNWMRIFNIRTEELCYRLGHDIETYLSHYGSPMIFTDNERRKIMKIIGEVQ